MADTTFTGFWHDHHQDGGLALWCAAPDGAQRMMVTMGRRPA